MIAIILTKQAYDTRICNIIFLELWLQTAPGDFFLVGEILAL